ncbi:MAG TPA: vanadium-dependent haloperoxidase [Candidatus Acidoferrum sp.]|nr:vanadium-dependent haloperoxidase [Candidatus Acidoferrum sp.]
MASRATAIVHTCMYDAWAAYDERAVETQLGGALRRPASERTQANKEKAISYAAYRALADLFPGDTETVYKPLMRELGYDPEDKSTDIETPAGIGNVACAAVLEYRHRDGANQLGDEGNPEKSRLEALTGQAGGTKFVDSPSAVSARAISEDGPYKGQSNGHNNGQQTGAAYEDWTGYRPVNGPGTVPARGTFTKPLNPDRWQPLTYTDAKGSLVVQMFEGAQWGLVKPFAHASGDKLRAAVEPGPAKYGSAEYQKQAEELVALSANLTDKQKMLAEYWSGAPGEEAAAARWMQFAEFVCEREHCTLDDEVKLFFALSNAMMDADIAAWDAKRRYDSVRPATAVPLLFRGKKIRAWGAPGRGTVEMDGGQWRPYQPATAPTPATPEFVSETSAESAAAARVLALWSGSDRFGYSEMMAKGSSKIEPGAMPAEALRVKWETFSEAANDAGMAGRFGGIQFERGDLAGRKLGRLAAENVWRRAQDYFGGGGGAR